MDQKTTEMIHNELVDIKRILTLMLLRDGASQEEIASALGVNQSSISRMFPGRRSGKAKPRGGGKRAKSSKRSRS
jgi:predicted XRE-type DNA-binding protein